MQKTFYPPREHPLALRLMGTLLPIIGKLWRGIDAIVIGDADLARLRALGEERLLLCANHPTLGDPLVIFDLGRRAGITFNYMSARELFCFPFSWLLQRLGAYSVRRGAPDRESIRLTRSLLGEENRQVVIFPEGLTHTHNDLLLPLHGGVVQIGFKVLEDLEERGQPARLPIVPVAIKYLYVGDACAAIQASLKALENALGTQPASREDLYQRLRNVGERVLAQMEREFRLSPADTTPLAARIEAARTHVVERVAAALDVALPPGATVSEQLHLLDGALALFTQQRADGTSLLERSRQKRRLALAAPLARDLLRLHNFIAVSDGYVAAAMTAERFLEVLACLEVEVLGRSRRRGGYRAVVRVGEPLELGDHLAEYRASKRGAVAQTTAALAEAMRGLLEPLGELGTPIAAPAATDPREEVIGADDVAVVTGSGRDRRSRSGRRRRGVLGQELA